MRTSRLSKLLTPAVIAVAALTLLGCAPASEKAPTASSPKPSSWEEHNEAQADAREEAVAFEEGDSDCPEGILNEQGTFEEGSTFEVIGTGEFMASSVGADVLADACVVRSTFTADLVQSVYEYAYVKGDKQTVEQIFESLTAAGYKPDGGDLFVNNEKRYVTAWVADTEEDRQQMAEAGLDFSPVVLILAWQDTPLG